MRRFRFGIVLFVLSCRNIIYNTDRDADAYAYSNADVAPYRYADGTFPPESHGGSLPPGSPVCGDGLKQWLADQLAPRLHACETVGVVALQPMFTNFV